MEKVRPNPYQEKQRVYVLIIVMIIMVLALIYLRILLGSDNDRWVCKDGVWIQQGNPDTPMPKYECE